MKLTSSPANNRPRMNVRIRRRDALPMTRDYMFEEERRLRALDEAPEWHLAA